jgi:hypothetical protein
VLLGRDVGAVTVIDQDLLPLRDHLHQTVVGGYVLAGVPGGLAELAGYPGTSQLLDSCHRRDV